jgi:ubiquinone/menaquinone biosynthesis C-methylase UbiE
MGPSLRLRASRIITRDYDRVSRVWDRSFVPATDELRRFLLDTAGLRPGERILDVGTGTGAAALLAARHVGKTGRVLGIDMSSAMLARARAKVSRSGLTNVTFRRMDGAALQLPRASLDVIISSFGTPEGVYDGEAVFRDWLRVLRPGGRLCFAESPGLTSFYKILRRVLEKHKVKDPSPALAARRRLWEQGREERRRTPTISGDEPGKVVRLLRAAGFRDVRATHRRSSVLLPSARTILRLFLLWDIADEYAEMRPKIRAAFRQELLRALRRYETPEGLRLPTQTNFFYGRKRTRQT